MMQKLIAKFRPRNFRQAYLVGLTLFLVFTALNVFAIKAGTVTADVNPTENTSVFKGAPATTFKGLDDVIGNVPKVVLNFHGKHDPKISAQKITTDWFKPAIYHETDALIMSVRSATNLLGIEHYEGLISFNVECRTSEELLDLYRGPLIEYTTIGFKVPNNFCDDLVRIALEAKADNKAIALGQVRSLSPIAYYLKFPLAGIYAPLLAFFVISIVVISVRLATKENALAYELALLAVSAAGFTIFFVIAMVPASYAWITVISFLTLLYLVLYVVTSPQELWKKVDGAPIVMSFVVTALVVLTTYVSNTYFSTRSLSLSAYPASWSVDNVLPFHFASDAFVSAWNETEATMKIGSFTVSDRGFTASGLVIALFSILKSFGMYDVSPIRTLSASYLLVVLQSWAFVALLKNVHDKRLGLTANSGGFAFAIIGGLCLLAPIIYNGVYYTWPKLLAGCLAFASLALFSKATMQIIGTRRLKGNAALMIASFFLFAFSTTAHSASVFVGTSFLFITVVVMFRHMRYLTVMSAGRNLALFAGLGVCLVSILAIFQSASMLVSPTSSYGASLVLTGNGQFGLTTHEVLENAKEWYAKRDFSEIVSEKLKDAKYLFWNVDPLIYMGDAGATRLNSLRNIFFTSAVLAAWPFLLIGIVYLAMKLPLLHGYRVAVPNDDSLDHIKVCLIGIFLSAIVYMAIFNAAFIHHSLPYAFYVAASVAVYLMAMRLDRRIVATIGVLTLAVFIAIYIAPLHRFG